MKTPGVIAQRAIGRRVPFSLAEEINPGIDNKGLDKTARLAGIRTDRVLLSVYTVAGLLYAVGAWVLIGRLASASPNVGTEYNLDSITAVVLGGERPHVLLEYRDGPRLSPLIRRYGVILEQLLPLALELTSALHYMAARGFVHLDVKPKNVVMSAPPRLIDLSVAQRSEDAATLDSPIGTDPYDEPLQFSGGWTRPAASPATSLALTPWVARAMSWVLSSAAARLARTAKRY